MTPWPIMYFHHIFANAVSHFRDESRLLIIILEAANPRSAAESSAAMPMDVTLHHRMIHKEKAQSLVMAEKVKAGHS